MREFGCIAYGTQLILRQLTFLTSNQLHKFRSIINQFSLQENDKTM